MMATRLAWGRRAAWAMATVALAAPACSDDEDGGGGTGAATSSSTATSGGGGDGATGGNGAGGVPSTGGMGGTAVAGSGPASASSGMGGGISADCTPSGDPCLDCVKTSCCAQLTACADPMVSRPCQCWWECQNNSQGTEPNPKCFDDCFAFPEEAQALVQCTQTNCPVCKK